MQFQPYTMETMPITSYFRYLLNAQKCRKRENLVFFYGDAIKRTLEADFPSGSKDEQLNMSDDSDMDPDYLVEKSNNDISSRESEPEVELDEEENPMPGPSNITTWWE